MPVGVPPGVLATARASLAAGFPDSLRAGLTPDVVKAAAAAACAAFETRWLEEQGRVALSALHNAGRCLDKPLLLLPMNDDLLTTFINMLRGDKGGIC